MKRFKKLALAAVLLVSVLSPAGAVGAKSALSEKSVQAVISFEEGVNSSKVSKQKLIAFEQNAINAIQQESNKSKLQATSEASDTTEVFNYISSDEDYTYLYESYSDGNKAKLLVGVNNEPTDQLQTTNSISPLVAVNLPDGWGGRQKISSSGNVLTTSVTLPSSVTKSGNGVPYIYVGFSGSKESDMGLQYATNRGPSQNQPAWVPFMRLSGNIWVDQIAPNNQVAYKNGYHQGASIGIQAYKNYNNTGKVRLVTFGYAICSDMYCTNTGSYYLTTISEYAMTVTSVNYWKVLATFAVLSGQTEGTGSYQTTFNDIVIDFVAVPSGNFQTPETDYATITRSANNVTINVNKT